MQPEELAARIDQTILHPEMLPPHVHKLVTDAMQHGLRSVVVPSVWVKRVATMLQGGGVRTGAVMGFPHGTSKSTIKAIEATSCIKDGADGIYVVAHLPNLIRQDIDAAKFELLEVVRAARSTRRDVVIHVIIETAVLMQADAAESEAIIASACRAVRESACDGIVTSSGFHAAGGASVEAIRLLRQHAEGLTLTATGGIDDRESVRRLLEAGADRIASERAAELVVQLGRSHNG